MKGKNVGDNVKGYWLKWMEAVGNTASDVANNTRYKVEDAKLLSKRQSIMDRLGETAYLLWQKGEKFPSKLDEMLRELDETNGKLNTLHSEHLAWIKEKEKAAGKDGSAVEKTADGEVSHKGDEPAAEAVVHEAETAVDAAVEAVRNAEEAIVAGLPGEGSEKREDKPADTPQKPIAEEISSRLDGMIDQLGSSMKKLGKELDRGLNRISDRLVGPQKTGDTRGEDSAKETDDGPKTGN